MVFGGADFEAVHFDDVALVEGVVGVVDKVVLVVGEVLSVLALSRLNVPSMNERQKIKSYLLNPRLPPLLRHPHADSLVHPPCPHHNAHNIGVLTRIQRRFLLASIQPFRIHVLQQLRPDAVR